MLKKNFLLLLLFGSIGLGWGQQNFIIQKDRKSAKIKFDLVNNLIMVPVELNGLNLTFLVDTGVNTTVLLNLDEEDSVKLNSAERIQLRGLGGEELIEAFRSQHNTLNIGDVTHPDLTVFVIYDEKINFSPRVGVPVHGIIGRDLFEDFVVEINYPKSFLRLHDPEKFKKNLRNYEAIPLEFFQDKPYLKTLVDVEGRKTEAVLLIDNGLSDALWLFPDETIKVPSNSFQDYLGLGLLGDVVGKRSRVESLTIGDMKMEAVTASFPDSLSVEGLQTYGARKGSVGSELLRRFHVIFDYENNKLYLRKNKWFSQPYHYDMSGIILEHSGFVMVETYEKLMDPVISGSQEDNLLVLEPTFYKKFQLKPAFRIARLRENSPALLAGLQVGDEVLKVNGKKSYKMGIEDFTSLFSSEEGKTINIEVDRAGRILKYSFELKDPTAK